MKYKGKTITKNKKCNTWYCRYRCNGHQYYLSAKTQQECYNKLKKALSSAEKLTVKKEDYTLQTWFNKWLELYKKDRKQNTVNDYYKSLKYLTKLENKSLKAITTIELIEILNDIKYERRKQIVYELLNSLFKKAVINEVVAKNPLSNIEKPKHRKEHGQELSNEDESVFIQIMKERQKDIFLITLFQGLRRGEVLLILIRPF